MSRIEFDDELDGKTRKFLERYRNFLVKYYGKRCSKRAHGCRTCQMWALFDLCETMVI